MGLRKGNSKVRFAKRREHGKPWRRPLELCWVLSQKISGEQGCETVTLPGSHLQSSSLPSTPGSPITPRGINHVQHLPCPRSLSIFPENSTGQCCNSLSPALAQPWKRWFVFIFNGHNALQRKERTHGIKGEDSRSGRSAVKAVTRNCTEADLFRKAQRPPS